MYWLQNVIKPKRIVNIGCPRLHEAIIKLGNPDMRSLLLDLDDRYNEHFPTTSFKFNMANYYFLDHSQKKNRRRLQNIFRYADCVFMNPPFTLREDTIKETVLLINSLKKLENNIPMFYFFLFSLWCVGED